MKFIKVLCIFILCLPSNTYAFTGDVREEIQALTNQINSCNAQLSSLIKELDAIILSGSIEEITAINKEIDEAESCLRKTNRQLNRLKVMYPDLFKSFIIDVEEESEDAKEGKDALIMKIILELEESCEIVVENQSHLTDIEDDMLLKNTFMQELGNFVKEMNSWGVSRKTK